MKRIIAAIALAWPSLAWQETELKDGSGKPIVKYVIEVPSGVSGGKNAGPARQLGLFLCFQEHDTPTGNDLFPVRQALMRQGTLGNYILLAAAPQSRKFGIADHAPIEQLIAWAMKTYPINPRRVYMFGKGEGSKISMEFAMAHPQVVTAAIGYSWGAWLMPSEINEPIDFENRAPEIYLTLGRRDLDHHLTCVRDACLRIGAKGYHLIQREFDELADRSYHPPSNDDAIGWATRLRNKNLPLSAEESKLLKSTPSISNGHFPALALVGGAQAGAVLEKLFQSKDPAVRAAAAETCRHGIFSAATTSALTKLVSDPAPPVRQSAISALGMYANWRYAAAQQALIQVAANKSADPADRINAVDGLSHAVRFQTKGVRQDPALFEALIALAQDKYEPVRAMAQLALAPAYEPAPPGSPRRRSPEGGWDKWLAEVKASQPRHPAPVANLAAHFNSTLKAAESGDTAAQAAVGMMYANGKGTGQNYAEAAKWWTKAGLAGDLTAARLAWNAYRTGPGVTRDTAVANRLAALIGEPVQTPRPQPTATNVDPSRRN